MSSPASPEHAMSRNEALQRAYIAACRLELRALKPGNVHVLSEGHGMTVAQFEASALASAPALAAPGKPVGERIRDAVAATHAAVGCNTNLGIVLLAAPLMAAAERAACRRAAAGAGGDACRAHRRRCRGGLCGDPRWPARPGSAMPPRRMCSRRRPSLCARRWRSPPSAIASPANMPATTRTFRHRRAPLAPRRRDGDDAEWAATRAYMDFLAAFADSHILRKHGADDRRERARRSGGARRSARRCSARRACCCRACRVRRGAEVARPQSWHLRRSHGRELACPGLRGYARRVLSERKAATVLPNVPPQTQIRE